MTSFSTVGIYNRWLPTLGGGERHAGAIAEALAEQRRVELLTHEPVDLATAGRRLGLDLSRVGLRIVADSPDFAPVVRASADYDLFVNASHLDYFAPRARRNALLVYFPATSLGDAQALGTYNRLKRLARRNVGRFLGERSRARLRAVVFGDAGRSSDQSWLGRLAVGGLRLLSPRPHQEAILDAYTVILANSEFTRRWIARYWGRDSLILYPPVEVDVAVAVEKRQWILSVGRFFAGSHNKKQVELIRAFRSIHHGPLAGWEFHLAGGYTPTESNAAYRRAVEDAAAGDPAVHLHLNCDGATLHHLYAESSLFWHGTGLGEDELAHPERFEHFGLTTVEAMAAGCVPLVLAKGGQPEIVRNGIDGVLWNRLDELLTETVALARDEPRRLRLAEAARRRARDFARPAFRQRLAQVMQLLEVELGGD